MQLCLQGEVSVSKVIGPLQPCLCGVVSVSRVNLWRKKWTLVTANFRAEQVIHRHLVKYGGVRNMIQFIPLPNCSRDISTMATSLNAGYVAYGHERSTLPSSRSSTSFDMQDYLFNPERITCLSSEGSVMEPEDRDVGLEGSQDSAIGMYPPACCNVNNLICISWIRGQCRC